jgi:hypothetical protein
MIKTGKIVALPSEQKAAKATGKPFTVHAVVLEDGTKIEVGFKQPYSVGEYFNRTVETKYGKLVDSGPAEPGDTEPGPSPSPAAPSRPAPPSGRTFPVDIGSPEMSIIRQNALTNAREAVSNFMGYPNVANSGATKAERQQTLDAIAEDIVYLAYKFTDFSSGQREVKEARTQARMNPPSV